jgi:CRISPR type I-D-associated protein Csc1
MQIKPIKLTLLNHLFYYTEVSGGTTSASVTGLFIGDLALNYAFNKCLNENEIMYAFRSKPDYSEIKDFGFYCTVAKPNKTRADRTENYIRNTLFNVDGFVDVESIEKSGKSPFKNYRQVQGIKLGAEFTALFLSKDNLELPPSIRVGTTKETLLKVEEIGNCPNDVWLNAYTLRTVFDNLENAVDIMMKKGKGNFSYLLENYNLIKQFTKDDVIEIFKSYFGNNG